MTNNGLLFADGVPVVTNTIGGFTGSALDVWIGGSPDYGNGRILQGGIARWLISPTHFLEVRCFHFTT